MKKVYKYEIRPGSGETSFDVPENAQFLSVQYQDGKICMWFLVDPSEKTILRKFAVYGTGWYIEFPDILTYLGTCLTGHERFVWHIFEIDLSFDGML